MHGLAIRYYTKRHFGQTHRSAPTSPRCFWYNATIKAILDGLNVIGTQFVLGNKKPTKPEWLCGLKKLKLKFLS